MEATTTLTWGAYAFSDIFIVILFVFAAIYFLLFEFLIKFEKSVFS